jgi:WD40-like Beta Propeller Repeat
MRALKIVLMTITVLLGGAATFIWAYWQPCSSVRECHWSGKAFANDTDLMNRRRLVSIIGGFTASASLVAFQVPVSSADDGIAVIDRTTKHAKLIAPVGFTNWSPRFSEDGERMVFVRRRSGKADVELISCTTREWRCSILLRTAESILSPVDIGDGMVLFAYGHTKYQDGKPTSYKSYDLYSLAANQQPVRLTTYNLLAMHAISLGDGKLYFQGVGGNARTNAEACSSPSSINCDRSEIFQLEINQNSHTIVNPPEKLQPAFVVKGLSTTPAISTDGTKLSFLNTSLETFNYRYNMKVQSDGDATARTIPIDGITFSMGAFVLDSFLVNDLFEDHYSVKQFDRDLNLVNAIDLGNSPEALNRLPRIELDVRNGGTIF